MVKNIDNLARKWRNSSINQSQSIVLQVAAVSNDTPLDNRYDEAQGHFLVLSICSHEFAVDSQKQPVLLLWHRFERPDQSL